MLVITPGPSTSSTLILVLPSSSGRPPQKAVMPCVLALPTAESSCQVGLTPAKTGYAIKHSIVAAPAITNSMCLFIIREPLVSLLRECGGSWSGGQAGETSVRESPDMHLYFSGLAELKKAGILVTVQKRLFFGNQNQQQADFTALFVQGVHLALFSRNGSRSPGTIGAAPTGIGSGTASYGQAGTLGSEPCWHSGQGGDGRADPGPLGLPLELFLHPEDTLYRARQSRRTGDGFPTERPRGQDGGLL